MSANKKSAVIEDVDAFMAWLATTPLIMAVGNTVQQPSPGKSGANLAADKDFLDALKSMA